MSSSGGSLEIGVVLLGERMWPAARNNLFMPHVVEDALRVGVDIVVGGGRQAAVGRRILPRNQVHLLSRLYDGRR